ncbi:MAG: hypothetical protein AAF591_21540 [Verrucomicrobiota bacterium]
MSLKRTHCEGIEACPFLPEAEEVLTASAMKAVGSDRGELFYERALTCAQSLWLQGYPAQSLLQINRALGADLRGGEAVLGRWPLPYAAADWVMRRVREGQFIGNPRRHYQHLATRMVEPRKAQRVWRAWGCWYLACRVGCAEWVADEKQIREEGVREPARGEIEAGLAAEGIEGEVGVWVGVVEGSTG